MELDFEIRFSTGLEDGREYLFPIQRALDATTALVPELANQRLAASIAMMLDTDIRELNREWRGKDKPTNVLSFPMLEREDLLALGDDGPPVMLGDIAFGKETLHREAGEKNIVLEDHIAHLTVHGLLHLAGYDHEISEEDADKMESLEIAILAKMGIADPYDDRD